MSLFLAIYRCVALFLLPTWWTNIFFFLVFDIWVGDDSICIVGEEVHQVFDKVSKQRKLRKLVLWKVLFFQCKPYMILIWRRKLILFMFNALESAPGIFWVYFLSLISFCVLLLTLIGTSNNDWCWKTVRSFWKIHYVRFMFFVWFVGVLYLPSCSYTLLWSGYF